MCVNASKPRLHKTCIIYLCFIYFFNVTVSVKIAAWTSKDYVLNHLYKINIEELSNLSLKTFASYLFCVAAFHTKFFVFHCLRGMHSG